MPTASKLVAAIIFAVLAWFTADLIKAYLPEGTAVGLFSPICAGFGFVVGWAFTGKRIGDGNGKGFGIGLTSSALLVMWCLLTWSGYEMLRFALRKRYDGPVEALTSMMQIAVEQLQLAAKPDVIIALVIGGLFGGWVTERVARVWP